MTEAHMSPLDPKARELWHNVPALMFMDFWQTKNRRAALRDLSRMLGVLWLREDAEREEDQKGRASVQQRDELITPLTCIIEPGILDLVKKHFGKKMGIDPPGWATSQSGETVDLFKSSKEDFLKFVRGIVSPKVS